MLSDFETFLNSIKIELFIFDFGIICKVLKDFLWLPENFEEEKWK